MGSVDCWLCQIFTRSLGTALPSIRALCAWWSVGFLLLRGVCGGFVTGGHAGHAPSRTEPWGTQWGQLNSWFAAEVPCVPTRQLTGAASATPCFGIFRSLGSHALRTSVPGSRIVTWLILPVVICLSQRLSHACLSISNYTVKLRMAH